MSKESNFRIEHSIKEEDIPPAGTFKKSKYQPILTACKTLEKEEGIKVSVHAPHVVQVVRKLLKNRHRNHHYTVTGRQEKDGHKLYIVRKQ